MHQHADVVQRLMPRSLPGPGRRNAGLGAGRASPSARHPGLAVSPFWASISPPVKWTAVTDVVSMALSVPKVCFEISQSRLSHSIDRLFKVKGLMIGKLCEQNTEVGGIFIPLLINAHEITRDQSRRRI